MNSTQNKKIEQVKETTMVIGIDVESEKPYFRAFNWRGTGRNWVNWSSLVWFWTVHGEKNIKFVMVNPHHVNKTKALDDNSPAKNDRKDPREWA